MKYKYIRGYLNTQNFQYRRTDKAIAPTKIQNPYFLLEWKRVSRNKELIFFSNIKNILTVFVLFSLLVQNFEWIGLSEKYAIELFLLVSCCAVNTISSTAYSNDPNKSYFSFLPISAHRLFFWKTIQGFLWGEITVLLFWAGVILFRNIPISDACLLLGYSTAMNYSCVWFGVFLDYNSSDCLGNLFFSANVWFCLSAFVCSLYKYLHCYDRTWIFDVLQEGL